jgi:hypothetical protein
MKFMKLKINATLRLQACISLLLFSAATNTAFADHRFGIGWSQWGMADDFDVSTARLTYEFGEIEKIWNIRPLIGWFYNWDNEAYYVSVGALKEWNINPRWSWGIGGEMGYHDGGETLGSDAEFYTRGVLNWHLTESGFFRLEVGHISNAGFGDVNPGSENLALTYNWRF